MLLSILGVSAIRSFKMLNNRDAFVNTPNRDEFMRAECSGDFGEGDGVGLVAIISEPGKRQSRQAGTKPVMQTVS